MSLVVDLSVAELASTRFAVSPLSETVSGLQQLGGRGRGGGNPHWIRWAARELAERPLRLTYTWPLIVHERPSWPQFLVPAPAGPETTIDDDLDAMLGTTARQVRASLRRVFGATLSGDAATEDTFAEDALTEDAPSGNAPCADGILGATPPGATHLGTTHLETARPGGAIPDVVAEFAAHPAAGLRAIASELREAHDRLIAPHWPRIRAVLDADIAYRARQLAAGGAERLFADLHPDLAWVCDQSGSARPVPRRDPGQSAGLSGTPDPSGGRSGATARLTLRGGCVDRVVNAAGGLVLIPIALSTPHVLIKGHTTTRTTLRYPARGVGALWTAGARPAGTSAVRLLGRHRANLLEALRSPATTTDLARALNVSPSAISHHLRVLRDSGLVTGERMGRSVLYLTTGRGLELLDPAPATPPRTAAPRATGPETTVPEAAAITTA